MNHHSDTLRLTRDVQKANAIYHLKKEIWGNLFGTVIRSVVFKSLGLSLLGVEP